MQSQMGGFDFGRWAAEGESSSNGCVFRRKNNVGSVVIISLHTVVIALVSLLFR